MVCEARTRSPSFAGVRASPEVLSVSRTLPSDLADENGPEPVPPQPHGLVANVDASFEQQILAVPQAQWKSDNHHQRIISEDELK